MSSMQTDGSLTIPRARPRFTTANWAVLGLALLLLALGGALFWLRVTTPSDGARLKIALALVGGVEIELIEPQGDSAPLFSAALPADGSFAIRFHHVAMRIDGTLADFEAHMASIDQVRHPVAWHGAMGDAMRYAYTDERPVLGHFVEHVWMHPDLRAQLAGAIPVYPA